MSSKQRTPVSPTSRLRNLIADSYFRASPRAKTDLRTGLSEGHGGSHPDYPNRGAMNVFEVIDDGKPLRGIRKSFQLALRLVADFHGRPATGILRMGKAGIRRKVSGEAAHLLPGHGLAGPQFVEQKIFENVPPDKLELFIDIARKNKGEPLARFLERETVSGIYSDEERAALCEGFPTVGRLLAAVRAGLLVKLTEQAIVELAYAHRVQLPKPFTGRPLKTHVILEYLAPKYPSREAMIADIERVVQEIPGYQFVAELERVEGEKR